MGRRRGRDRVPWMDPRLDRERRRDLLPAVREGQRSVYAHHEAGHFLVSTYLGHLPESIGIEVGSQVKMGVVWSLTGRRERVFTLSRTDQAAVLYAGGLAQERLGVPRGQGSESDLEQIEGLLPAPRRPAALRRARLVLDLVWTDVPVLAGAISEQMVLSGETAIFYVLAQSADTAQLIQAAEALERPSGAGRTRRDPYASLVDLYRNLVHRRRDRNLAATSRSEAATRAPT
jgi:hypothetical protein